jgi:CheY-like chemotaxis protein
MSQTRVPCVENHPEYLGALKYVLETGGYEVMAATNGDQALRLVTTLDVDAFLLEYYQSYFLPASAVCGTGEDQTDQARSDFRFVFRMIL